VKKDFCIPMSDKEKNMFGIDKLNIKRSEIPAVTHVDYTSRIQTVNNKTNLIYYKLICEFFRLTGVPILVNTSFNVRGEPMVCFPEDAFKCFMGTDLDILVVGNYFLKKGWQNPDLLNSYENKYQLD